MIGKEKFFAAAEPYLDERVVVKDIFGFEMR